MPAAVISITKRGDESGLPIASVKKIRFFDITADTGTYASGGFSITAAQVGLATIDFAAVGSVATSGTSGATANVVGVTYATGGSSITVQVYEAAASGVAFLEKTNAEAYEANWIFRLMVIGQ